MQARRGGRTGRARGAASMGDSLGIARRQLALQGARNEPPRLDHLDKRYAIRDAMAVENGGEVSRREVATCPGGIGATAETAGRRVENRNSHAETGEHVGERGAARVVQM